MFFLLMEPFRQSALSLRFLFGRFPCPYSVMNGTLRTHVPALPALDAFPVTDLLHVHLAGFHTGIAVCALLRIHFDPEE